MENIILFNFNDCDVRVIVQENGNLLFVAVDVCRILDLEQVSNALKRLDADEVISINLMDSLGREQRTNVINESGLYSLILGSKKPEAKVFKKWVTSEVLPQIRKTSTYTLTNINPEIPQTLTKLVELIRDECDNRYINYDYFNENMESLNEYARINEKQKKDLQEESKALKRQLDEYTAQAKADWEESRSRNRVYLMYNPKTDEYKIGKSQDIQARKKTFQTVEIDIETILTIKLNSARQALSVERLLHLQFEANRTHGEWFKLAEKDLNFIKNLAFMMEEV